MKKILFLLVTIVMSLVSCTDQQFLDETLANKALLPTENEFNALIEQARWGDGQAYLKLADCYRDGKGVKKDFINMLSMMALAKQYGGIKRMEDYLMAMPNESEFKLILEAIDLYEHKKIEESQAMTELLIAQGSPDGYSVESIIAVERGDTLEGKRLMEQAALQGSTYAELLLCIPEWRGANNPNVEKLKSLVDSVPLACKLLADIYTGNDYASIKNERLAIYYYLKADEQACLGRRGASWLLNYHRNGGQLQLTERDIQRLQKLACEEPVEEKTPQPCNDEILETAVSQMLQEKMTEMDCKTGAVYIVETQTGSLKANVSLMRKGNSFVPYEDTYTEEQSNMLCGPTYLALLSSGRFTSESKIDTEFGIYKDVKDHNWHRGGYGQISLEQALGYRSQVAFTKAKEVAFRNDQSSYNQKISSYLGTAPNQALGILAFYNAVANGGRMVQVVTEGDDVIVLDDQIAAPEHIAILQQGLQRAVSQGRFRKVGRDYTDVAACGRTFWADKKTRRMELCGYFPADDPMYTIMVVLEKNGLPASAGGMCGPIMASTIDALVDSYDLQPMLVREYEEPEEIIEVVETVAAR